MKTKKKDTKRSDKDGVSVLFHSCVWVERSWKCDDMIDGNNECVTITE